MSKSVSEVITESLLEAGVTRCYGIVGDTINHFTNAIHQSELDWVHVRHEEVGALAAGGEAYMTGKLTACAGTCGPGSLHFLNGIFESHRNGAPVLLIASNVDRTEEGLQFPQEVDQTKLYEQCSVFCSRISHPDQARRIIAMAAQAAVVKQGVAVVVVNGDMFKETTSDDMHWRANYPNPVSRPSDEEMKILAKRLNNNKKLTIYAGYGAKHAHDQVVALAEKLNAPVVHTSKAKEFIEPNNPYNIGMNGILGNKAGMHAVNDAEVLLCLGCNFAYTQFYPQHADIIQIDIDGTNLGKRSPVDLGLVGDVAFTLDTLLPMLEARGDQAHLNKALKQWKDDQETYQERGESEGDLIHPQTLTRLIDKNAPHDAIFTADGGSPMVWLLRHLTATGDRRFLTSLSHGTMANAFPQALGIAKAYPERTVIAMCGDGGMTMLMGDLLTLVQEKLPVKLVVYNNRSLGFVEMEQRVEGMLDAYTDLKNPDFSALAQACGLKGWRVETAEALPNAIDEWLRCEGPAILDVAVNRMELVMPPEIEAGQVASTAMFGIKAVLNGRTDEVVSLLKDNFIR